MRTNNAYFQNEPFTPPLPFGYEVTFADRSLYSNRLTRDYMASEAIRNYGIIAESRMMSIRTAIYFATVASGGY
jgi:hypothetical protein